MSHTTAQLILHVAIDKPMRHCFDYLLPKNCIDFIPKPGMRIQVPFGKKQVIGILLKVDHRSCIAPEKLKPATAILDAEALLPLTLISLYEWASQYYQHPIGEVILGTLPLNLRQEKAGLKRRQKLLKITAAGLSQNINELKRSPRQAALLTILQANPNGLTLEQLKAAGFATSSLKLVMENDWVERIELSTAAMLPLTSVISNTATRTTEQPLRLNSDQQQALGQISAAAGFKTFLLEGVTGSGKTEIYLQAIAEQLAGGKQALVLVPEIGLTPQTIARFQQRFAVPIVTLHSKLSDHERFDAWLKAKNGEARIVIGTRSAIFTPFSNLGIIILDEEHDHSFKQQSGFRYSARDLAIVRARMEAITVILGTATPSMETLYNAQIGRFVWLKLPDRAGMAVHPTYHVVDIRNQYLEEGLSPQLLAAIQTHLVHGNQVLLFLNRRGFAPILLCHGCGWSAKCRRCDATLTLHQRPPRMICHHCTATYVMPKQCGQCANPHLVSLGYGTERLEQALTIFFPTMPILRIDRDTTSRKGAMEKVLTKIHQGGAQILIGTQMLAKGHHFPNVTLVGIIDTDGGLYSSDFRATEHMGQLIVQVAGRAGRAEKSGQVFLQTHHPEHPLLLALIQQGYAQFSTMLLQERKSANWPPFSFLTLIRAQAAFPREPMQFLQAVRELAEKTPNAVIQILGPIPAPMERKAGQFRALLLFQSSQRAVLQQWLENFMPKLEQLKPARKVRWSVDVDPLEMF